MGRCSTLNSKLWTILHGLEIAKHRVDVKVVLESDGLVAMKMINDCLDGVPLKTIIRKIKNIIRYFKTIKFQFVRRESNLIAD